MASKNPYARYERIFPQKLNSLPDITSLGGKPSSTSQMPTPTKQPFHLQPLAVNDGRYKDVEARLSFTEHATSTIVDNLIKEQSESKVQLKRQDELLLNEIEARKSLDASVRMNRELTNRIEGSLKKLEATRVEDQKVLTLLVAQVKVIEQRLLVGQKGLAERMDVDMNQLSQMNLKVIETMKSKEQLEYSLIEQTETLKNLRSQLEAQAAALNATADDVRNRLTRLELENKITQGSIRSSTDSQQLSEHLASQLKSLVERRFNELSQSLFEVRGRQESERKEMKSIESKVYSRINEVESSMNDQLKLRDETYRSMDSARLERFDKLSMECSRLQDQLNAVLDAAAKETQSKVDQLKRDVDGRVSEIQQSVETGSERNDREVHKLKETVTKLEGSIDKRLDDYRNAFSDASEERNRAVLAKIEASDERITALGQEWKSGLKRLIQSVDSNAEFQQTHQLETSEQFQKLSVRLQGLKDTNEQSIASLRSDLDDKSKLIENMMADLNQKEEELKSSISDLNRDLGRLIEEKLRIQSDVQESQRIFDDKIDDLNKSVENILKNNRTTDDKIREMKMRIDYRIKRLADKLDLTEAEMEGALVDRDIEREERRIEIIEELSKKLKTIKKECKVLNKDLKDLKAVHNKSKSGHSDQSQEQAPNDDQVFEMTSFKTPEQRMNYLTLKIKLLESRVQILEKIDDADDDKDEGDENDDDDDDEDDDEGRKDDDVKNNSKR